ncbi:hypothetical protein MRB53_012388 [Persea americana]|uniref:Uncharacterized protein n=1 Tax=Persea americana TaxID=3435 RepID=A0ACC2LYG6_PERAE|nr:hypothetical protein MRB53_012388 [Persea americana]
MAFSLCLSKRCRNEQYQPWLQPLQYIREIETHKKFSVSHGILSPRREMKELDLLSRLEECRRDDSNPTVDCTLKLGLPSNPVPEFPVADKKPRIDFPMIYGAPQVKNDKCPTINGGHGQEVMGNKDKVFEEAKVREGKQVMGKKCWLIEEEDGTFTNWEDVGSGSPQPPSSSSRRGDLGVNGSSSSAAPPPMLSINDLGLPNTNNQELPAFCNLQQHNVPTARTRREEPQVPVEKRCTLCMRTASPLWRNGPLGLKTLCNACGLRVRKEGWSPCPFGFPDSVREIVPEPRTSEQAWDD